MLLRILVPLLILLFLSPYVIDRLSLRHRPQRWLRWLLWLPPVVVALMLVWTAVNEGYTLADDRWKGQLLSLAMLLIVPGVLSALTMGIGYGAARAWRKWGRALLPTVGENAGGEATDHVAAPSPQAVKPKGAGRTTRRIARGVALIALAAMIYGLGFGYRRLVVTEYHFAHSRVPAAFTGYRIVQLSDLHLGTLADKVGVIERMVQQVNALKPDLVVVTGDVVNYHPEEVQPFVSVLKGMQAKDGVVSVMGNHDYLTYHRWPSAADSTAAIARLQQMERNMGWRLLLNAHHIVRRGNDSIAIVGVENEGRPPFPARADLKRAQRGLDDGCFRILLSHDPTHWRRAIVDSTTIPLTLSGHTHGMQFKVGRFSPAAWFYPEWGGAYVAANGQTLHVSLGMGAVLLPFRLGAWPEINLIVLENKQAK